jgi:hypothetical protein
VSRGIVTLSGLSAIEARTGVFNSVATMYRVIKHPSHPSIESFLHSYLTTHNTHHMSRTLDNSNPTIFAPTASTSTRRIKPGKALLWDDDDEEVYTDASDEVEEIDAEEVFGMSAAQRLSGVG